MAVNGRGASSLLSGVGMLLPVACQGFHKWLELLLESGESERISMAICSQSDIGLSCSAFPIGLLEGGLCGSFSRPAAKASYGRSETSATGNQHYASTTRQGLPDLLWPKFLVEATLRWEYMRGREALHHPNFAIKKSKEALWLDKWCHVGLSEPLVRHGCHIPKKVFCHVLQKCMDQKDLLGNKFMHLL